MKTSEKQAKFAIMVANLILWINTLPGHFITMGEVYRTQEQQEIYIVNGYSRVGVSKHQHRMAFDVNLFVNGKYEPGLTLESREKFRLIGEKWEDMGGRWGGRFGTAKKDYDKKIGWDPGHFEI